MPKTHIIIMKKSPFNACFSRYMKEKIASNYEHGFLHKNLINFLPCKLFNETCKRTKEDIFGFYLIDRFCALISFVLHSKGYCYTLLSCL